MIILETQNRIIKDTLINAWNSREDKIESIELQFADFDGVVFHLSNPTNKSTILLSIRMKGFHQLDGCKELLEKEYSGYICNPENGFDFSLEYDLLKIDDIGPVAEKASSLRRNCFAAPFYIAFDQQEKGTSSKLLKIDYRDEESIFIQAHADRVTVIFSVLFRDESDIILSKIFLQEFVDARRQPSLQITPQVLFSKEPPREVVGKTAQENVGYVTFVLFSRHFGGNKRDSTIDLIQTFRDYLHYHIKCSKAYLHSRMRHNVSDFLKVLNRAKPEVKTAKKLASGKTFNRNF